MESEESSRNRTDGAEVLNGEDNLGDNSKPQTEAAVRSPSPAPAGDSTPQMKGYGLKKWRRIKRDVSKDSSAHADDVDASNRILKRGLSAPSYPAKGQQETKPNSEDSVGSTSVQKIIPSADGFSVQAMGLGLDSRFSVGTDSENSEDRSSKSSTAASAPKLRYDQHTGLGSAREKNRVKNINAKGSGSSAPRFQQGKGRSETSKKAREEIFQIEKENSYSSVESDSRSSNSKPVVFAATSNGKLNGGLINDDGENSDDAHTNECCTGKNRAGSSKGHVADSEDLLQHDLAADLSSDAKESKSENHPSTVQDPLTDSIRGLQSLQEVLERELHKFGEIGNETPSPDSINIHDLTGGSNSLESNEPNVQDLESKLEEAKAIIALRDSKVAELETFITSLKLAKEKSSGMFRLQDEHCKEMEIEFEALLKKRIESEIECLAITKAIQNWMVAVGAQPALLKEQEILAREQIKMLNKLGEAESRQSMLMKKAEELEKHRDDILGVEESYKMQRRVFKLSDNPEVVVPT